MIKNFLFALLFGLSLTAVLVSLEAPTAYAAADFNCHLTSDSWFCDTIIEPPPDGCISGKGTGWFNSDAGAQMKCEKLPAGDQYFCRNTQSLASCGPSQQAIRDQILKDLGSAPAGKVVCRNDTTFHDVDPQVKYVVYCSGSITSTHCKPAGSGSYSVCSDWSDFKSLCNLDGATTVNGTKNYVCSKPTASTPIGGPGEGGTSAPNGTPTPSTCANGSCAIDYAPLEPLPGYENLTKFDFAGMLNLVFKLLISIGALFAVGTFVYGGIVYMVSGATGEIGEAKKRMQAAVFALLLIAGSWLILYTVNPKLLEFNLGIDSLSGKPNTGITPSRTPTPSDQAAIDACEKDGEAWHFTPTGVECH